MIQTTKPPQILVLSSVGNATYISSICNAESNREAPLDRTEKKKNQTKCTLILLRLRSKVDSRKIVYPEPNESLLSVHPFSEMCLATIATFSKATKCRFFLSYIWKVSKRMFILIKTTKQDLPIELFFFYIAVKTS